MGVVAFEAPSFVTALRMLFALPPENAFARLYASWHPNLLASACQKTRFTYSRYGPSSISGHSTAGGTIINRSKGLNVEALSSTSENVARDDGMRVCIFRSTLVQINLLRLRDAE